MKEKRSHSKRPLRIAQIAPLVERVPPKKYGGTERIVYSLTEKLVEQGHEVTLFASGDSITSAKLFSVYPRGLREAKIGDIYGLNTWTLLNIGSAYKMQKKFDIIHDHNGHLSLPVAHMSTSPVLMTLHGPITSSIRQMFEILDKPKLVTVSKSQGAFAKNLNIIDTVYNGLDMAPYLFQKSMMDIFYL